MNIISFTKSFAHWDVHFDILGAIAFGFGLNFFPNTIGLGISLGPFVLSISYSKFVVSSPTALRHDPPCDGSCSIQAS